MASGALSSERLSEQLLQTMSETLDVREMFPQLSEVAMRILPCDRFTISFDDERGHIALHAATPGDFPRVRRVVLDDDGVRALRDPFYIADDLAEEPLPVLEPPDLNEQVDEIGKSLGRPPGGLTREAARALERYTWPGNVRELRNALERASIICDGGLITIDHLGLPRIHDEPPGPGGVEDLRLMEQQTIAKVLRDVNGNKSAAARRLGLSRTQLYVRLRKYELEPA